MLNLFLSVPSVPSTDKDDHQRRGHETKSLGTRELSVSGSRKAFPRSLEACQIRQRESLGRWWVAIPVAGGLDRFLTNRSWEVVDQPLLAWVSAKSGFLHIHACRYLLV